MNERLSDLYKNAEGAIIYMYLDGPNFPPEDNMSTEKAFVKIRDHLRELQEAEKNEIAHTWIRMCSAEVDRAEACYASGDDFNGSKTLDNAYHYLGDAKRRKSTKPTFIAGDKNFGVREVKG